MIDALLPQIAAEVTGILHVGAHTGQEADAYARHGITNVVWVEANPRLIPKLEQVAAARNQRVIQAAVWGTRATKAFRISNNEGHSSSLLEFGTHRKRFPSVDWEETIYVETTTLDDLAKQHDLKGLNLLVMDIQGAEERALSGGWTLLRQLDFVICEIAFEPVYQHAETAWTVDAHLQNFTCIALVAHGNQSIFAGDALYRRFRAAPYDLLARA